MATSDTLLQRWHSKLVDASTATRSRSVRSRWLGTLYIRLYRFLLSVYGPDGWGTATSKESPELPLDRDSESATGMAFVDNTSEHRPTKPRSIDAIREVLDRIHEDIGETVPQNPAYDSTAKPDWLIVATSREISLRPCRRILSSAGIDFRTRWFANYSVLEVPQKQFEESVALIRVNYRSIRKKHHQYTFIVSRVLAMGIAWVLAMGVLGAGMLSIWGARIFHSVELASSSSIILTTFCALTALTVCAWFVVFKRFLNP